MTDAQLAAQLALQAGQILLDVRASGAFEGKALGKEGDRQANAFLCEALRRERPDDGLLSEEEKDDVARCSMSRVWIVDPVDGTREYGEARSDWAVHVGLAINGEAHTGAVALPGLDGGIVLRTDQPAPLPEAAPVPRLVVSRTRPAKEAVEVSKAIGGELVPMGSAGFFDDRDPYGGVRFESEAEIIGQEFRGDSGVLLCRIVETSRKTFGWPGDPPERRMKFIPGPARVGTLATVAFKDLESERPLVRARPIKGIEDEAGRKEFGRIRRRLIEGDDKFFDVPGAVYLEADVSWFPSRATTRRGRSCADSGSCAVLPTGIRPWSTSPSCRT